MSRICAFYIILELISLSATIRKFIPLTFSLHFTHPNKFKD